MAKQKHPNSDKILTKDIKCLATLDCPIVDLRQ